MKIIFIKFPWHQTYFVNAQEVLNNAFSNDQFYDRNYYLFYY